MTMLFGTKAETLEKLQGRLTNAVVLPQYRVTQGQWKNTGPSLLKNYEEKWLDDAVIVRSSCIAEDTLNKSLAGRFASVANVRGREHITQAIDTVINSFTDNLVDNQIFIQPMLIDVAVSGVLFSRDVNTGAPYFVINYDDKSGATDSVTSGKGQNLKTFYHAKCMDYSINDWKANLLSTAVELEQLFDTTSLDVEFAVDSHGALYIFQVRPLINKSRLDCSADEHRELLSRIINKVNSLTKPHPYLYGDRSAFGVMPDWNPAEVIGIRPRPMSLSLYKELITDNIWAYQRKNYGYRDLRSFPLIISFGGLPYIDVRVSFNSFIPANVSDELASKLVNHYIDKLSEYPNHHDKVEFEIIYSCYTLDLPERLKLLQTAGFTEDECSELQDALRILTNNIIHKNGLWKQDIEKIETLEARRKTIIDSDLNDIEKIYWVIEDCKRYGTLPFAGLARAGFIAVQLLHSLIAVDILSTTDIDAFMNTLDTVSSTLATDLITLRKDSFLEKYGHLRPGTYDILSARYDEQPDTYFDWQNIQASKQNHDATKDFKPGLKTLGKIAALLSNHKLEHDILSFFDFIKKAIEGREYAKFVFTKSLSEILRLVALQGQDLGFDKEDVSYADINIMSQLYSSSLSAQELFAKSIAHGKANVQQMNAICLPPLIVNEHSIVSFELPTDEPNFITLKSVTAQIVNEMVVKEKLKGSILMIPSADPGYDWIFSQGIVGFITMYGGANSHMAIRAAELGVPAVIGAGELQFNNWSKATKLTIDCGSKFVRLIS